MPMHCGKRIKRGVPMPGISDVREGDGVWIQDARGELHFRTALSGPEMGDFPIIWISSGRDDTGRRPWPVESVWNAHTHTPEELLAS
jgi:hypothetical protein